MSAFSELSLLMPPRLRLGDEVIAIAPSGPFDHALAWRGLGWLAERYRVRFDRSAFKSEGYLAGTDERRLAELDSAFRSTSARAILAIRGGYGLNRIAHQLDWDAFLANPKWIVGFSDITALHVEANARGVSTVHGPMVASLGRADHRLRSNWCNTLENPYVARRWDALRTLHPGHAQGVLVGGNLTILHACAAAGRLRLPRQSILFLEDVGEAPYRLDRLLTTLLVGGHFKTVCGVVCGQFTACHTNLDGVAAMDVVQERFRALHIPVLWGLPSGHELDNEPLVLGQLVRISSGPRGPGSMWTDNNEGTTAPQ